MPRIVRTPRAKADALSIGRYIAEQSGSRSVALRFLDKIDAKLKFLAQHPSAGEMRPELAADVRSFPVGNYVIFYRPSDDGIDACALFTAPAIFHGFFGRVKIDRRAPGTALRLVKQPLFWF